ncbi:unnamed protein product [Spirodela intermedia]|uniref:Uncharacterized protein n=1 Tax=Spirodela intermedia TaxID=51605 RepID=A0A7I8IWN8_SPIIN|nr:unnamed protein product [Spirodela intermedia]CAA6662389.1 unnamed protein product [Spirodela intermedia]
MRIHNPLLCSAVIFAPTFDHRSLMEGLVNRLPFPEARCGGICRCGASGLLSFPRTNPGPNGKKVANLSAKHKESINEFINHPSGVESILNTRALQSIERLETSTYRCTLPRINFLNFEVVPVIVLRVTSTSDDCMVEMLSCKFEGSQILEQQSHRFSGWPPGTLNYSPIRRPDSVEPSLSFDVNLSVALEVYTKPFTLLPVSAVETPGNLIVQGLIDRLVPQLVEQLLEDYRSWVEERVNVC